MATEFTPAERAAMAQLAREDFYTFARWMFIRRKGFKWLHSPHHALICDALNRVYRGECRRLIINIPPRYSKTELAVVNWVAWCMGRHPDAEFIHASYSAALAINNSRNCRDLTQHEAFSEIFPEFLLFSDAGHDWRTTQGGVMYATGAEGTITGFGAGKHRAEFGGCFPVGTRVWTEFGLMPIDRIVKERLQVNVWSFDYAGQMVLRPVIGWHQNPPNEIVRVTFDDGATVECTPDHRFWTDNRGWVRADSLRVDDHLPTVNGGVEGLDGVSVNTERCGSRLDPEAVLPARPVGAAVERDVRLLLGQDRAQVRFGSALTDDRDAAGDGPPRVAAPNLIDDGHTHAIGGGKLYGGDADSVINCKGLRVGQERYRVDFGLAECSVALAVEDVRRPGAVAQVGEAVVFRVPVSMTDFATGRAGSDEGVHYKGVNGCISDGGAFGQANSEVSACHRAEFEHLARLDVGVTTAAVCDGPVLASNAPVVTDRVKPFISGNRSPVLVERIRHDDSTFCLTVKEHHNFTIESGLVVKNCIVLDDVHKASEASSDVMRKNIIDWFQNTVESRKNDPKNTPIIVIGQRLHEEDLPGWLINGGNGEKWELLALPAICEAANDPLGREIGDVLWTEKHDLAMLRAMQEAAPYTFAGQYQQTPVPLGNGIFRPEMIEVIDALPAGVVKQCRGWDLASTVDGDYTAGVLLGRLGDGRYIICDALRLRDGPDVRDAAIKSTASRDGRRAIVGLPQDPGQAGKTQIAYLTRALAGFVVKSSPESGDKVTRAEPMAAQVNVGNVLMLRGAWNDALINEMRSFPFGKFDDQVDAMSRAFSEVMVNNTVGIFT